MLKKIKFTLIVCFLITCYSPNAGLITHENTFNKPYSTNFFGDAKILKSGETCSIFIQYVNLVYSGGDGGITGAMEAGGITKIALIDYKFSNYLFLNLRCVKVWGE